ncbi:hypothetical protein UlMin_041516 [Ulmus minor]
MPEEKLIGGLVAPGFDENSCLSRYQSQNYEELHQRCGPSTKSYNEAVKQLKSGHGVDSSECKYVVWISFSGLGNRMITIASCPPYKLDLFCEPFPEISLLLPPDFPIIRKFDKFNHIYRRSFGKMLKKNLLNTSTKSLPSYLYLHLAHDYDDLDRLFFCDQEQNLLEKVPWLIMKTNNYFFPSLFLMPSFEDELGRHFPEKGTVFHHLGRWTILKDIYWQNPTVTGDIIGIYQPSHEVHQQTEKKLHNRKAWAEMYLLSLTDVLVTSAWSTFGDVAQGLGGLKPWIMCKPVSQTVPNPPCCRIMSMEPCFHAPPFYDCKAKKGVDTGALVPHLRQCEDMSWGLKLVDSHDEIYDIVW